jgi:hypothetical protein
LFKAEGLKTEPLSDGAITPEDILKLKAAKAQQYLVNEIQVCLQG